MKWIMIIGMIELGFLVFRLVIGAITVIANPKNSGLTKFYNTLETVITVVVLWVLIANYYN